MRRQSYNFLRTIYRNMLNNIIQARYISGFDFQGMQCFARTAIDIIKRQQPIVIDNSSNSQLFLSRNALNTLIDNIIS